MAVVINTNVDALKIQNMLTNSTNDLSKAMQRMSSGLKINSAKDDAAGTVISARMNVQLDGNKICQNNVQNANAMLSTAEGNIDVVLENITRIRDLTLEAKNGTYSNEEIKAMQDEVSERIAEIDRISSSAKYSQLRLFGGTELASGATFQVGANSSTDNVIKVGDGTSTLFDSIAFNDIVKGDTFTPTTNISGFAETDMKNAEELKTALASASAGAIKYDTTNGNFVICAVDSNGEKSWQEYTKNLQFEAKDAVPASGMTAGDLFKVGSTYYVATAADTAKPLSGYSGQDVTSGVRYSDSNPFDLQEMAKTPASLVTALDALDNAIDDLTDRKSQIGSAQSRLNSALDTLTTQYANLTSSKSIITDADVADEASKYTQNQILQQVSTSLLAQANQAPSIALSLL